MALRTPLYDWHVAQGARIVEFGGWDMPIQYTTIIDEHQAVRTGVGLFDISHMGRLVFQGADAARFLEHVFTNQVATMKPGQVRYGLICNEQGGILDDVLVYRLEPFWLMVVNASNREKILAWLERQRPGFDVQIEDKTRSWGMVALQGPQAHKLMAQQAPDMLQLRYFFAQTAGLSTGHLPIWSRTGYTGEDGWEVIVPASELMPLVERLSQQVAPQVGLTLKPCGLGARDTLRLEAAMPLYGHELSEHIDPLQAGLGWAVKFDKSDFVGKAAMQQRTGQPAQQRVGLELQGKRIAREGAAVLVNGQPVGQVTSGTFSPTLGKSIAMAYVPHSCRAVGTECAVAIRGKSESARVVPLPFYQRAK